MEKTENIHITETPRDAMQSWPVPIATASKATYINALLKVGFETVDAGSFVSPKAVPQMADTADVLKLLDTDDSNSKLMVIVGNKRGGLAAASESKVQTMGFPYSVSGTFLKRNLNSTPEEAWQTSIDLKGICERANKNLRIYLTLAFGNPYGDEWNDEIVFQEVEKLYSEGIRDLVLSDTTGEGKPGDIERLCSEMIVEFPEIKLGIHLHTKPDDWQDKVEAAWRGGVRYFEGAQGGFGGCPMTGYELIGNLDTLALIDWCRQNNIIHNLNTEALSNVKQLALEVFK